jgi:hypothetical protein
MYWRTQLRCQLIPVTGVPSLRVTVRENESVSVPPLGALAVKVHVSREENVGSGSHTLQVSVCV